jgi:hypothetical protein
MDVLDPSDLVIPPSSLGDNLYEIKKNRVVKRTILGDCLYFYLIDLL